MRNLAFGIVFVCITMTAATPDITGVWKADIEKSKVPGPPVTAYIAKIEKHDEIIDKKTGEKAPQITETWQVTNQRGEQRNFIVFFDNGKPMVRPYQGVPTRLTTSSEGSTVKVMGEVAGHPSTFKRTYELSDNSQTLTVTMSATNDEGKETVTTYVMQKQPDSAAAVFDKPEFVAGDHFKNVKTDSMKGLPESEFINNMRYISWSLGKNCEFCHVREKFDSDEKKEKKTARDMIDMVASIDHNSFKDKPEVRCFTCHEGHEHPPTRPQFPDETGNVTAGKAAYQTTTAQH